MNWSFDRAGLQEFIRITASGDFCSTQYGAMLDELVSLPYWRAGTPLLFDFCGLGYSQIDAMELLAASDEVVSRTPVAMVMGTPEDMEMGRRFGEITDDRVLADPRRFLKEADAISWLKTYFLTVICVFEFLLPTISA